MNVLIFNKNIENLNQLIKYIRPELNNFLNIKTLSIITNFKNLKTHLKKFKVDLLITDNLEFNTIKIDNSIKIILISPEYINLNNSIIYTNYSKNSSNKAVLDPIASTSIKFAINGLLLSYNFNPYSEGTYLIRDALYYALIHNEKTITTKSIKPIYSFLTEKYNINSNCISTAFKRAVKEMFSNTPTSKTSLLPISINNTPREILSILLKELSTT